MRAASLRSCALSSAAICCGAPLGGSGTKNLVPGPMDRPPVVFAAVLAEALTAGSMEAAVRAAAMAATDDAHRRRLEKFVRMLLPEMSVKLPERFRMNVTARCRAVNG